MSDRSEGHVSHRENVNETNQAVRQDPDEHHSLGRQQRAEKGQKRVGRKTGVWGRESWGTGQFEKE